MKYVLTLPPALQLLSIKATIDVRPSSINKESTSVEAMVVIAQ